MFKETAVAVAAAIIICAPVSASDQPTSTASKAGWLSRLFERPSWTEAVASVDSPKRAAKLVRMHVRFQEDIGDEWADGKTTWDRGFGDCEDFAAAVVQLCKEANLDVNASIQVFSAGGVEGHAVAFGSWRDRFWIASNGWFEFVDSMEEASDLVAREMGWRDRAIMVTPLQKVNGVKNMIGAASASDSVRAM